MVRYGAVRRPLFNVLCALSLLLCVVSLAMWGRSRWVAMDHITIGVAQRPTVWTAIELDSWQGSVCITFDSANANVAAAAATGPRVSYRAFPIQTPEAKLWKGYTSHLGFIAESHRVGLRPKGSPPGTPPTRFMDTKVVGAPWWFIALALLIMPNLWLRKRARMRRNQELGLCVQCGYDLRASPHRCPECGTERVLATDEQR